MVILREMLKSKHLKDYALYKAMDMKPLLYIVLSSVAFTACAKEQKASSKYHAETHTECFSHPTNHLTVITTSELDKVITKKLSETQHYYYISTKDTGIIRSSEGRPLDFLSTFQSKKNVCKRLLLHHQGSRIYEVTINNCGLIKNYHFDDFGKCSNIKDKFLVSAKRALIYDSPSLSSKIAAYFINSDEVISLEQNSNWIKVSYRNGKRIGWVRREDLTLIK